MSYKRMLLAFAGLFVVFAALACGQGQASIQNVSVKELKSRLDKNPQLYILDVRTPGEYNREGHIKGAKLLPVSQLSGKLDELSGQKDQEIFIICAVGSRSSYATVYLSKNGFKKVYNVTGGMVAWKKNRYGVSF